MRLSLLAMTVILLCSACVYASTGIGFGRISYQGDLSEGCAGEPSTARLYRITQEMRLMPVFIRFGFEYAQSDFDGICESNRAGKRLRHFGAEASGGMTVFSFAAAKVYAGVGLSYNWVHTDDIGCQCTIDRGRVGYHGLVGLASSVPGSPIQGYLEARLGRLNGSPDLGTRSIYCGLTFPI
jgi:opacity protein-like surface antigen